MKTILNKYSKIFYNTLLLFFITIPISCSDNSNPVDGDEVNDSLKVEGYALVWNDEFSGSEIDKNKWGHEVNATGGGNNELQYYTDRSENSFVDNGSLHIVAQREEFSLEGETRYYTSARMRTANKGDWLYGRIDVKAKLPFGQGLWPAIWMLSTDWDYGGWPESGEIDIMEHVGYDPGRVHASVHTLSYYHKIGTQKTSTKMISNADNEYHIYSLEWSADSINVSVDGTIYFTFENDKQNNFETWPFDKRFHLILNVAVGGDWPGDPTPTTLFPAEMVVDYVRVYEKR